MVPLSFIILTLTICGARPLLQRCIGSTSYTSQLKSGQQTQQQRRQDPSDQHHPSASSPLLGHPQDPHRYEGYSSSTHYNAIDQRVNGRSKTRTHLGSTLPQEAIVAKKQAAESSMSFCSTCERLKTSWENQMHLRRHWIEKETRLFRPTEPLF